MKSLPNTWLDRARGRVATAALGPDLAEIGRVISVGDGIALVSGLPGARLDEVLRFGSGQVGFAQTLEADHIGCVLLDDNGTLEAGEIVHGTGEVVRTLVGAALLGRVVDPLGRPLDEGAPVTAERHDPVERPAPAILDRALVTEPVQTGILVIDSLFPLGRGQRELIIGDRSIGKTAIAVDTMINQKLSDMICIYVAVGQKSATVARVIDAVRRLGAPERCVFVVASAAAPPGLQWVAPFAGMTMAEYFRDRGQHALVVIDDLTKHAATHREIALLTRQPPGREAYPGDVFYLHARLLERAAKLAPALGGGSLTALPIAETDAGNLSAYIPTNLISITDGQLVLDARLFHAGQKPAIDIGTSVSRVGGKTQAPALREVHRHVSARLRTVPRAGAVHPIWQRAGSARAGANHPWRAPPRPAGSTPVRTIAARGRGDAGHSAARGVARCGACECHQRSATGVAELAGPACRRRGGQHRAERDDD